MKSCLLSLGALALVLAVQAESSSSSVLPVTGAVFHLDANNTDTMTIEPENGTNYVSRWNDAGGGSCYAKTPDGASRPFLSTWNGLTVMDFGRMLSIDGTAASTTPGIGGYMVFSQEQNDIREVFMVVSDREECPELAAWNFIFGNTRAYVFDFHRGVNGTLFNTTYAAAGLRAGVKELDFAPVEATTSIPAGFHVLHFSTTSNVRANTLCNDRSGKYGGLIYGEIVIYNRVLTEEEVGAMNGYLADKWQIDPAQEDDPAEVDPVEAAFKSDANLIARFDAGKDQWMVKTLENGTNYVSQWYDADGRAFHAKTPSGGSRPYLTEYSGKTLVDFGPRYEVSGASGTSTTTGIGGYMEWSAACANVREVFLIVADHPTCAEGGGWNFFLCAKTTVNNPMYYNFHRGSNGKLFHETYASTYVRNGLIELDGETVSSDTVMPEGLHLLHLRTTGNVFADALCYERSARYGGLMYGEILVYNAALSDEKAAEITQYLMKKWIYAPPKRGMLLMVY